MRALHREQQSSGERWRVVVCLALVALLLHNPFFTILGSSRDISVRHVASYRATVASSELRRCTLQPAKPLLPELTAAAIYCGRIFLSTSTDVGVVQPSDAIAPVSLAACDSVWFRPPPLA